MGRRVVKKKSLKEDRILANINLESAQCPLANPLDNVRLDTSEGECCGSTCSHGLTCDGLWEKTVEIAKEPAGGD